MENQVIRCEKCNKVYQRVSSLRHHIITKHEPNKLLMLQFENQNLQFKMNLYVEQIKFLKRLIVLQEQMTSRRPPTIPSDIVDNIHDVSQNEFPSIK